MSVVRVHKTNNFTIMSNHHFKEKGLSLKAKGLLSLMLSLPDTWNYSISGLVTLSKDGKDSVMSALGELERFGYLTRERVTNERGQFAGVEYNIFETPEVRKPVAVKPISVNPMAENRPQLNIKKINNKKNKTTNNNFMDELQKLYSEEL